MKVEDSGGDLLLHEVVGEQREREEGELRALEEKLEGLVVEGGESGVEDADEGETGDDVFETEEAPAQNAHLLDLFLCAFVLELSLGDASADSREGVEGGRAQLSLEFDGVVGHGRLQMGPLFLLAHLFIL